jgi:hypothetical protein
MCRLRGLSSVGYFWNVVDEAAFRLEVQMPERLIRRRICADAPDYLDTFRIGPDQPGCRG